MKTNTDTKTATISRRSVLRTGGIAGGILIGGATIASTAGARRSSIITVEPDELILGTCGFGEPIESFEVSLARGGGRTEVFLTGFINDTFLLGGPNPSGKVVTVEGPIQQAEEIVVRARRGAHEDQATVRLLCIPPIE